MAMSDNSISQFLRFLQVCISLLYKRKLAPSSSEPSNDKSQTSERTSVRLHCLSLATHPPSHLSLSAAVNSLTDGKNPSLNEHHLCEYFNFLAFLKLIFVLTAKSRSNHYPSDLNCFQVERFKPSQSHSTIEQAN